MTGRAGMIAAAAVVSVVLLGCVDMAATQGTLVAVEPEVREWTVAVYMAADNDLESAAIQDLNEMEAAAGDGVTVVALLDRGGGHDGTNGDWTDSRLYLVERDAGGLNGTIISRRLECPRLDLYLDRETELDMADPWVLGGFLEYTQTTYPSQHTVLVVWGHGTGWRSVAGTTSTHRGGASGGGVATVGTGWRSVAGTTSPHRGGASAGGAATVGTSRAVAIDDTSGSYMRTSQLETAVAGRGLSAIVFDTCFGSTVEVVYQLASHTQLLAGAAGLAPSAGLDYRRVLDALAGGATLEVLIKGLTADNGSRDAGAKMSVVDTAGVQELRDSLEDFAAALAATITSRDERDRVAATLLRDTTGYHHGSYPCDLFLDVADMAERFTDHGTATVVAGARRLRAAVEDAVTTPGAAAGQVGLHLIPLASRNTTATGHSQEYVRGSGATGQGRFVAESHGWAPTDGGGGGSLLDRLFYTTYGN